MKILVHSLPARAAIDTQVQEQLIVELYSQVAVDVAGRDRRFVQRRAIRPAHRTQSGVK